MIGELQKNLELLQASYGNVQNVLRFLDTKAGVIFALAGALLAAVISSGSSVVVPQINDWECVRPVHFSLLSGIASLFFAVKAIWPSYGPKDPADFTWLYPSLHPKCYRGKAPFPIPRFEGFLEDEILDQYRIQLNHLSKVLMKKTWSVRMALGFLLGAVILLIVEHLI